MQIDEQAPEYSLTGAEMEMFAVLNYSIEEAMRTGAGADAVISLMEKHEEYCLLVGHEAVAKRIAEMILAVKRAADLP